MKHRSSLFTRRDEQFSKFKVTSNYGIVTSRTPKSNAMSRRFLRGKLLRSFVLSLSTESCEASPMFEIAGRHVYPTNTIRKACKESATTRRISKACKNQYGNLQQ